MKKLLLLAFLSITTLCSLAALPKPLTISALLLTDAEGIADRAFNAAAWKGLQDYFSDNPGLAGRCDLKAVEDPSRYAAALDQASDGTYDLVVVAGFLWAEALEEAAPRHPRQRYLIVDVNWLWSENILEVVFPEEEGSYLVGVAAALRARTDGVQDPQFGFIGGIPGPVITAFEMGYIQGIRSILPAARIVEYYANDWGRPDLAKAKAKSWYDSGVYAIFSAAGPTGNGAIQQAKEYRSSGKNVWAIGVDTDQFMDGLYGEGKSAVLTSMIKRVDRAVRYALGTLRAGRFEGGIVVLKASSGGVDLTTSNPALGPDLLAQVYAAQARLASGQVRVVPTYAEARAKGLVPDNLQASDR